MPYQRVLLVHPSTTAEWRGLTLHIGQAYLAQSLKDQQFDYDVLDMNIGYKPEYLLKRIADFNLIRERVLAN